MKWTTKWGILFGLAQIPGGRYLHEWMLRRHGELASLEKSSRFRNAIEIVQTLRQHLGRVEELNVVEIGTGWVPAAPLALALCGARVQTYDVRRLTDAKLFHKTAAELGSLTSELALAAGVDESSIQRRLRVVSSAKSLGDALPSLGGSFTAPADTCRLPIADGAADAVVSSLVLQCIPAHLLRRVLKESWRVLKPDGLAVHRVRMTDEYAAGDPRRNHLEYLSFSHDAWDRWYNHRLKHQNRLRASQFMQHFQDTGFECVEREVEVDADTIPKLKAIGVDTSFAQLGWNDLATVSMSVVLRKWMPQPTKRDHSELLKEQTPVELMAGPR